MIGTILQKPVDSKEFQAVMAWCCNDANSARMLEYRDRYEVAVAPLEPEEEPEPFEDV